MRTNEFGQAIGDAMPDFTPGRLPAIERIEGRYTVIERLSKEKHGADLYQVYGPASPGSSCGPICSKALPEMKRSGTAY